VPPTPENVGDKHGWSPNLVWSLVVLVCGLGCEGSSAQRHARTVSPALTQSAVSHYAALAFLNYRDAAQAARTLATTVDAFVNDPSRASLEAARKAWLAAREPYLQSEVFRFYEGPIDQVEMFINPWPIDESYVESAEVGETRGIIDDLGTYPVLTRQTLLSLNEKQGETSISTGFHVIELLLWGRDTNTEGPGNRSHADYLQTGDGAPRAARRGTYLKLASELLAEQLEQVRDAWEGGRGDNYRAQFLATPVEQGLEKLLKGLATLSGGELTGERLTVAYETKDQENEHSCFSDNTHRDLIGDILGIQNVCTGRYVGTHGEVSEGVGLCELVAEIDPALASTLRRQIAESLRRASLIPVPFDQTIVGLDATPGRRAIRDTLDALQAQNRSLSKVAVLLGASVPVASVSR